MSPTAAVASRRSVALLRRNVSLSCGGYARTQVPNLCKRESQSKGALPPAKEGIRDCNRVSPSHSTQHQRGAGGSDASRPAVTAYQDMRVLPRSRSYERRAGGLCFWRFPNSGSSLTQRQTAEGFLATGGEGWAAAFAGR